MGRIEKRGKFLKVLRKGPKRPFKTRLKEGSENSFRNSKKPIAKDSKGKRRGEPRFSINSREGKRADLREPGRPSGFANLRNDDKGTQNGEAGRAGRAEEERREV